MSDIDFDELDKAVASALKQPEDSRGGATASQTEPTKLDSESAVSESPQPHRAAPAHVFQSRMQPSKRPSYGQGELQAASPTASEIRSDVPKSIVDTPAQPHHEEPSETIVATTSAPTVVTPKRTGRFMDIMHPSGDMRQRRHRQALRRHHALPLASEQDPTTTPPPDQLRTKSQAVEVDKTVVKPSLVGGIPLPREEAAMTVATHNAALEDAINELFVEQGHPAIGKHHETDPSGESQSEATSEVASLAVDQPLDNTPEPVAQRVDHNEIPSTPPQQTPFLAGAVIEKRPLSTYADTATTAEERAATDKNDMPSSDAEVNEPELVAAKPRSDTIAAPELPAELHQDLVAIESSEAISLTHDKVPAPSQPQLAEAAPPIHVPSARTKGVEESTTPEVASIAPQYRTPKPAVEADEESSIFDTEQYHQPLQHPEKKSSGWGWVIAIILIILICGGLAVFAWMSGMFVIPS